MALSTNYIIFHFVQFLEKKILKVRKFEKSINVTKLEPTPYLAKDHKL